MPGRKTIQIGSAGPGRLGQWLLLRFNQDSQPGGCAKVLGCRQDRARRAAETGRNGQDGLEVTAQ